MIYTNSCGLNIGILNHSRHSLTLLISGMPALSEQVIPGAECSIQVSEFGMRCRNVWHASQLLFRVQPHKIITFCPAATVISQWVSSAAGHQHNFLHQMCGI